MYTFFQKKVYKAIKVVYNIPILNDEESEYERTN